jgi:copper chaperone NosL
MRRLRENERRIAMSIPVTRLLHCFFAVIFVALVPLAAIAADTMDLPDGSKLDLSAICPICEMKVGAGNLGPAAVVFKDGKVVSLDGPGDFFRYVLSPAKYGFDAANIKAMYVTEHGTKSFVDAKQAFYVLGSDVTGGMGPEAIPFSKKESAEKFQTEHHGKSVAAFSDVTLHDLKARKKILKMEQAPPPPIGGGGHGHK